MTNHTEIAEPSDREAGKLGMWIFLFTEMFLFGGLFLVYAVFRSVYSEDFHRAADELNTFIGTVNTVFLLTSSMTVAMSITAIQKKEKTFALLLIMITLLFAGLFLVNKYFEWSHEFHYNVFPGSEVVMNMPRGELLFISLYFMMTGLHALHVIIGMVLLTICLVRIKNRSIHEDHYLLLENSGLYWHLVDLIWIFLFPLLYLIT